MKRVTLGLIAVAVIALVVAVAPAAAQVATSAPLSGSTVMVVGPIEFIDGDIVVNGYIIAPAGAFLPALLTEGDVVIVIGILLPDGITIQATEFEFFEGDFATLTPSPTFTPTFTSTPSPTWDPALPIWTPTLTPTFTLTPTATPTGTLTLTPTVTPTWTVTPLPTETDEACNRPGHPVAQQLADAFGVSYEEIIGWHCAGFGFGEIARAYLLAEDTGEAPDVYFALKAGGMGWGQIVRDAGISGSEHSQLAPGQVISGRGNNDDGERGNGNGNGNGNRGNGRGNGRGNNGRGNGNGHGNGHGNGNGRGNR